MDQEFEVTVSAPERRFDGGEGPPASAGGPFEELPKDAGVNCGVTDDAATGDFSGAGFELGLEQDDAGSGGWEAASGGGQDFAQGDEREVGDEEVERGEFGKVAGVGALRECDARVVAEALVELGATDIDGEDGGSAVLKEAVREATGGGAEVEAAEAGDIDFEGGECGFEFFAAPADVARGFDQFDLGGVVEKGGGLHERLGAHAGAAGHDEAAGALPCFGEATFDEQDIGADTRHA